MRVVEIGKNMQSKTFGFYSTYDDSMTIVVDGSKMKSGSGIESVC